MWLLVAFGCGDGPQAAPDLSACDGAGETSLVVVRRLSFGREVDGVSDGFDLDGVVTADGGGDGCGIPDLVGPDGEDGVDNAFAYLIPALELTEAAAVESLIQATIDSGELLLSIAVSELDDPVDDRCVDVGVRRAVGVPMIGTDGRLLTGQTFDPDPDVPVYVSREIPLVDGTFESPLALSIPIRIFAVDLEFAMPDARIRGTLQPDGSITGVFAGGVDIEYLLSIAREENVDPGLAAILGSLLDTWADLAPGADGRCTQVSITFEFEAVPAFWYAD